MNPKLLAALVAPLMVAGCLSSEKQIEDAFDRNPDLFFKVIEKNPEKFVETVNLAVRKAQEAQSTNRQAQLDKRIQEDLHSPKRPLLQAERTLVGIPGAEIVVVEYGDFQCPACAVGYQNFKSFKDRYKDEMQFIFKHMPLDMHPVARDAALAFELIRMDSKEKAFKFYEECFREPGAMNSEKDLENIVKKLGYDWKTLRKSKRVPEAQKIIQADIDEFTKFGFNGTPSFIMNGVALPGAQPPPVFDKIRDLTTAVK